MTASDTPKSDDQTATDQWAQAVVDGMPAADMAGVAAEDGDGPHADIGDEASVSDLIDGVPTGEVPEVDLAAAAEAAGPIPESWFAEGEDDDSESAGGDASTDGSEATGEAGESTAGDISVEDLVLDLERVTNERDQYLDASRRLQAEFENYKKQVGKREVEARERANDSLVGELLPVLDAFDGAVANGAEDVVPMRSSFLDALAKQGLERIDPADDAFDPNLHEAVMHEDADDVDGPVVAEVMRAGYVWKGRVLRPAMVRTRG